MSDMSETDSYWVVLNREPRTSLPLAEGDPAQRRFQSGISRLLQVEKRVELRHPNKSHFMADPATGDEIGLTTDAECEEATKMDGPYVDDSFQFAWSHPNTRIPLIWLSPCRALEYQYRCGDAFARKVLRSRVTLPDRIRRYFIFDWDADGDKDFALQLVTGQFIFLRQEHCPKDPEPGVSLL